MVLEDRKRLLLDAVIKEHIKTAKAIGSHILVEKYSFELSPATIRNEMMELEKEGYLRQPYTSAGRVPTEKAYRFYIQNFLEEKEPNIQQKNLLKKASKGAEDSSAAILKKLAKTLAHLSHEAVVLGFDPHDVYYTGISNVFHQPDFSEINLVYNLSEVVDHLDEAVCEIFNEVNNQIQILIGKENPFGKECGVILTKYHLESEEGLLGILGPIRMDYQHNQSLMKYTRELISNI